MTTTTPDTRPVPAGSSDTDLGCVILLYGLPAPFTVGCDAVSWTAGRHRDTVGLCHVPDGAHLIWVAHPAGTSVRAGVFFIVTGDDDENGDENGCQRVHAVAWDPATETLRDVQPGRMGADSASPDKLLSYRHLMAGTSTAGGSGGGGGVGGGLHATRPEAIWRQLTGFITATLLSRVTGQIFPSGDGAASWHLHTTDHVRGETLTPAERAMEEQHQQRRRQQQQPLSSSPPPMRQLRFTLDQTTKTYSTQQFGAARTLEATDSTSYILAHLSNTSSHDDNENENDKVTENDLVGELQLAFIAGVHLGNDACLEQWWHMLLRLVLRAYTLPLLRPRLAADWLRALTAQLTYAGGDDQGGGGGWLDVSILDMADSERGRALRVALIVYKRRLDELLDDAADRSTQQPTQGSGKSETAETETEAAGLAAVAAALARLQLLLLADPAFGWDLGAHHVRLGRLVLDDGHELELEMDELQADEDRGEWAPVVVELDDDGRQTDLVSWS